MSKVHTDAFFREDIVLILPYLTEKRSDADFFKEIDEKTPAKVPIVDAQSFALSMLTASEFNMRFRPMQDLTGDEYQRILEDVASPVLVFNSRRELIFRNKACRRLLRILQENLGGRQTRIEEYLPPEFFSLLSKPDPERVYELMTGSGAKVARYRLSRLELGRGEITVATFFAAGADRAVAGF
jgi:PAS domain-containing protein